MASGTPVGTGGLTITGLVKSRGAAFTLGPVDIEVARGACLGLVGANGSGKTTLLRCILASVRPDQGHIAWASGAVRPYTPTPRVAGLVEEPRLFNRLTALENLRSVFVTQRLAKTVCQEVLERVGLDEVGNKPVGEFSQGMRQRLGIARVLLADAGLIILDEPTNGLDPLGIRWLSTLILELRSEGRTIIVSSHLLHEVQQVATNYALLNRGQMLAAGLMADISAVTNLEDLYFSVVSRRNPPTDDAVITGPS
ncbi:MAG: ABC transporter ATP-binding protein [Nostocoides sp.]